MKSHGESRPDDSPVAVRPSDLVTVMEASKLLRVSAVTVWRWIKSGRLASYRVGPKAIRIHRSDLNALIRPARAGRETLSSDSDEVSGAELAFEPMSDAEMDLGLQAMRDARRLRDQMSRARGGRLLPDSIELIRTMREERLSQLDGP